MNYTKRLTKPVVLASVFVLFCLSIWVLTAPSVRAQNYVVIYDGPIAQDPSCTQLPLQTQCPASQDNPGTLKVEYRLRLTSTSAKAGEQIGLLLDVGVEWHYSCPTQTWSCSEVADDMMMFMTIISGQSVPPPGGNGPALPPVVAFSIDTGGLTNQPIVVQADWVQIFGLSSTVPQDYQNTGTATTYFTIPAGIPPGTYQLRGTLRTTPAVITENGVTANDIASFSWPPTEPVSLQVGAGPATTSLGQATAPGGSQRFTATFPGGAGSGHQGDYLTVTGSNWDPNREITINFGSLANPIKLEPGQSEISSTGSFQQAILVPADATLGSYTITVAQGSVAKTASIIVNAAGTGPVLLPPDIGTSAAEGVVAAAIGGVASVGVAAAASQLATPATVEDSGSVEYDAGAQPTPGTWAWVTDTDDKLEGARRLISYLAGLESQGSEAGKATDDWAQQHTPPEQPGQETTISDSWDTFMKWLHQGQETMTPAADAERAKGIQTYMEHPGLGSASPLAQPPEGFNEDNIGPFIEQIGREKAMETGEQAWKAGATLAEGLPNATKAAGESLEPIQTPGINDNPAMPGIKLPAPPPTSAGDGTLPWRVGEQTAEAATHHATIDTNPVDGYAKPLVRTSEPGHKAFDEFRNTHNDAQGNPRDPNPKDTADCHDFLQLYNKYKYGQPAPASD